MPTTVPPPDFQAITYVKRGAVAAITLNRPTVLNALNQATIVELTAAFTDARDDDGIRGVILTGAGGKAFAAGADISELATATPVSANEQTRLGQELTLLIETLGKPVVAAVNGLALGGGCELAMACHLRLAAPDARFGQPEIKLGLIPGFGGTQRLARLIGRAPAIQLILTGETISAADAYRLGLINEVVPADQLLSRAEEILSHIGRSAPLAVRYALQAITEGLNVTVREGMALEGALFAVCASSEDMREGTSAFLEKRPAAFKGR
ncbi:enoyl-CoA hydratase [Aliidongia dinghuensis]|uniref:Enoyl-CoA hydratase n=1 Tax=Aliidongia dinghuensis TaxID=1867774 RepID=A0A8J2YYB1_9PROT|nr:enoyl-CoA hydratase-related protein [Aliidongia dinghuensis]GGF32127.1 enoyl-CoA hydratase [Aliidongia dinghuensis]